MARRRVKLALVENESSRKVSFRGRKQSLRKKMDEITTLCDVNGCMVIYDPQDGEPLFWPSREEAENQFKNYESLLSTEKQSINMDQEKFMEVKVEKLRQKVNTLERKNKELKAGLLLQQIKMGMSIEDFSIMEVELLVWYSENKLKEMNTDIRSST